MVIKDDLSTKLIHFVKGSVEEATSSFNSILSQGKVLGGAGDIVESLKCVCFTESPLGKFSHVLSDPARFGFRYAPLGIMVDKTWLYEKGGRPVIYQSAEELLLLHQDQKYRHKEYNPLKGIDFTWEREWRVQIDELIIDPRMATVIVPNRSWVEKFKDIHISRIRSHAMIGLPGTPQKLLWHFIALEDLGVEVLWSK